MGEVWEKRKQSADYEVGRDEDYVLFQGIYAGRELPLQSLSALSFLLPQASTTYHDHHHAAMPPSRYASATAPISQRAGLRDRRRRSPSSRIPSASLPFGVSVRERPRRVVMVAVNNIGGSNGAGD